MYHIQMAVYKKILQVYGVYPHIIYIYIHIQNIVYIYYTYILYIDMFVRIFLFIPSQVKHFDESIPGILATIESLSFHGSLGCLTFANSR